MGSRVKGDRFCPPSQGGCGAPMVGPTKSGVWSCTDNTGSCKLICCKFDRAGNNPYDVKFEGFHPLIGFQGDRRVPYELHWNKAGPPGVVVG